MKAIRNSAPQTLLLLCALMVGLPAVLAPSAFMQQQGGNFVLNPSLIPGGGGTSSSGNTSVTGTIGQGILGSSSAGNFSLDGGFWQAAFPCAAPALASQPSNQTTCAGSSASFVAAVTGTNPSFQWRKNGSNLTNGGNVSGATSATLTINPAAASDTGSYDVVVTGACGSATSNAATLTVNAYSLSSSSQSFPASGGTGSVNVIVADSCPWTPVSNDGWITITSGTSGAGNGAVNYSVANNTGAARTGTITIAGLTFTVNQSAPTLAQLISFNATGYDTGMYLEWQTGFEVNNLGFRIYRDDGGKRTLLNGQMLAGSALVAGSVSICAGRVYSWWDGEPAAKATVQYWLEDIDLNGQSTWHGPIGVRAVSGTPPARSDAAFLSRIGAAPSESGATRTADRLRAIIPPTADQLKTQAALSGKPGLKILVRREGWYRVTQSELLAAGFDARANPRFIQLYAEGQQIPMSVETDKQGQLTAVAFYGMGLDAAYTDARAYLLVRDVEAGLRIPLVKATGYPTGARSFLHTAEHKGRTIYFSALRNGEKENFFGAVVASEPVNQSLILQHVDQSTVGHATLEVSLQGVTLLAHRVWVYVNEAFVGEMQFNGQLEGRARFSVEQSLLNQGANQVRLVAEGGPGDVSLVDWMRLSYWHTFSADDDALRFTATGNQAVTIDGFTSGAVRVLDVTNPDAPEELLATIDNGKTSYSVTVTPSEPGERTLLAIAADKAQPPASLVAVLTSRLRDPGHAADLVIISHKQFLSNVEPLRRLRVGQGLKVEVASVDEIYNEFSFGNKSPQAIKDFLAYAKANWKVSPRYVLLLGDASYDPKNYLGLGDNDLVPTKLIDTEYMETASDDWFADFNGGGMAVGRLPARSPEEAHSLVSKIVGYDAAKPSDEALLVADSDEGFDFEMASTQLKALLPASLRVNQVDRGSLDPITAKKTVLDAINRGQKIVNYFGHGNTQVWRGNLLTVADARDLTNSNQLSMFVMMTCLNGYFQDAATDSLAESLLKSEHGGAIAVWASSAMTLPEAQAVMNQEAFRQLFSGDGLKQKALTIGDAIARAKAAVTDGDVRRTWILLGDPTTRLR